MRIIHRMLGALCWFCFTTSMLRGNIEQEDQKAAPYPPVPASAKVLVLVGFQAEQINQIKARQRSLVTGIFGGTLDESAVVGSDKLDKTG